MLKANEVFIPGAFPTHTYVTRSSHTLPISYELRLTQALSTTGYLTSIIGPSKTGKTVLCERVVGFQRMISLSGADFKGSEDFWSTIAKKVGISLESGLIDEKSKEGKISSGLQESRTTSLTEFYRLGKDKIIDFFNQNDLVLVLDDFHYAPEAIQLEMAHQLKDAIRQRFTTIVISLPFRADDAIRKNPDLSGRLSLINIEPWNQDELSEIAITGFKELGMEIDMSYAKSMAVESLASPQLMQAICLNLSLILDIDNNKDITIEGQQQLINAYRLTSSNLSYEEVIRKLKLGPSTRGNKRKAYVLAEGNEADIYELVLKSLAIDPPSISISLENMKKRVDELVDSQSEKPTMQKIKETLSQVQAILQSNETIYQVLEYKDDTVYILEPLFLFYLRWGVQ
ncbi:ATP-binding protein [Paenibacillus sp. FSL H8-0104]|uniref:ATP-binding protein n=1 Tax=Paenibacillus sp. FSL H8-0104 TaxID=2954509 RepID=UPI0030FDCA65